MIDMRKEYDLEDDRVFFYINKNNEVSINIRNEYYKTDCSFEINEIQKKPIYATDSEYLSSEKQYEIFMHIERSGLHSEVFNYLKEVSDSNFHKFVYVFFEECHEFLSLINYEQHDFSFYLQKFCFNSGLDNSIQFYLNS